MRLRLRRGFTLVEMLVATTLLVIIFGLAVPFFRAQTRALTRASGRMEAQMTASGAMLHVDRELRAMGVNLVDNQPMLVRASPTAITFNTDLVSRTTTDFGQGALYVDSTASVGAVAALHRTGTRITLPGTTTLYPGDTASWSVIGGVAETISFYVELDNGDLLSGPAGTYRLMRRVNAEAPQVVARGLVVTNATPVFRYYVRAANGNLREIPGTQLPLLHEDHRHNARDQRAASIRIDSIRAVRVNLRAVFRDPRDRDALRTYERTIRIPNAGVRRYSTCRDEPDPPASPFVAIPDPATGLVTLTWGASPDEAGGENDVVKYTLYRRRSSEALFNGDPIASIAAGFATYTHEDLVAPGTYVYAVAASDCGRLISTPVQSSAVTMP